MICRGARCLLLLLAAGSVGHVYAQNGARLASAESVASGHFAAGSAAFESGDYQAALTEFRAAIAAGAEGPSAYYNEAVCLYRLGDFAAAANAFRALGVAFPQMRALADYNLGLSLIHQNEVEAAREPLQRAAASDDKSIATLARAMLARVSREPDSSPRSEWLRVLDLSVGNDDNVALIDPLGLPAGLSTDSPFSELSFYAGGPVTARGRWNLSANAYRLDYSDASAYDQTVVGVASRYQQAAGNWVVSAGPRIGRSDIGGDGFERYVGAEFGFGHRSTGGSSAIDLTLTYDDSKEIDSRFAYIAGDRLQLGMRYTRYLPAARLALEYRYSDDDRAGAGVSAERDWYRLSWRQRWGRDWTADFLLEFRDSDYAALTTPRHEQRYQTGLRVLRALGPDWSIAIEYRYTNNDASDATYTYTRHRFSFGASWLF